MNMNETFDFDLAAIRAFVAVGDVGGFRKAATSLGMTSAAISKAVSRLEQEIGVALFARTTRSVRLTSAGESFHARCKAILADLDQAGHEAAKASGSPHGRLVISASRAFGRMRVLPVVANYLKQYPLVDVEMRLSDRLADLVTERVDLAIRIGHLPDSSMIATRIGQTGFVLCGSPEYLATCGTPRHPDDLLGHSVVGYVAPDTATRFAYGFLIDGTARLMSLPCRLTVDDGEAAVSAAARSVGLVMVNDYLVDERISSGSLVRVLREFEMPPLSISLVYLPTRNPSTAAQTFAGMLRRRIASAP